MSDIAIQIFAISGAVFWSTQLIPQIWLNYSRHSTEGLSGAMMMLWSIAGLPLGIHNILSNQHIALQVQAQILTGLSLATWAQTRYYGHRWSARRSIAWLLSLAVAFGTIETAIVVGVKYGNVRPAITANVILATAILSAILLGLGVLRHYWDIYEHRSVRGISWGFVVLDAMGDLTSLIAIVLAKPIDPAATAIYGVELALWIGIMLAGVVFNLVPILKGGEAGPQGSPTQLDTITTDRREALTETSSDSSAIRSAFAIVQGTLLQRNVHPRQSTRTEPSV